MLNLSKYAGDGHALNTMTDMQFKICGGSYFWRGIREKEDSDKHPTPPLVTSLPLIHQSYAALKHLSRVQSS